MNINWSIKIKELEAAGFSLTKLSEETGLAVSSISDIKQGYTKEPKGMAAVIIHDIHKRFCRKKAA